MKLYAVTAGEYSDYHIITLQADEKKAQKIAEVLERIDYDRDIDVEEFESDDWEDDPRPVWLVRSYNGNIHDIDATGSTHEGTKMIRHAGIRLDMVKAKTSEQARKIVQDRLAEEKARKEGLT
jgi:hypothetical protein